jgi:hypothetical protein
MIYQRNTKTSVRLWADEVEERECIVETMHRMSAYESKLTEASFFTACEIFIGTNLPTNERIQLIHEISDAFHTVLKKRGIR